MDSLPSGPERELMWDERYVGLLSGLQVTIEVADDTAVIASLSQACSPEALLVLLGRMRLAQLRGKGGDLDIAYERTLWEILPKCIANSPHLYLGTEALLMAVDLFLEWSPFADQRFTISFMDDVCREPRRSFWDRLERNAIGWPGLDLPPADFMAVRKSWLEREIAKHEAAIDRTRSVAATELAPN